MAAAAWVAIVVTVVLGLFSLRYAKKASDAAAASEVSAAQANNLAREANETARSADARAKRAEDMRFERLAAAAGDALCRTWHPGSHA